MNSLDHRKEIYKKLAHGGKCVNCGKENDRPNRRLCSKCEEKQKRYRKKSYERKKSKGLCISCGAKVENGAVRCESCSKKQNELSRERYSYLQEIGICPKCGKNELWGDEKLCLECSANLYSESIKKENRMTEDKKKKRVQRQKEWKKQQVENGYCSTCFTTKLVDSRYKTCHRCRELNRQRMRKNRTFDTISRRVREGKCRFCENPVKNGYKVCESHYQKLCDLSHGEKATKWREENKDRMYKYTFSKCRKAVGK